MELQALPGQRDRIEVRAERCSALRLRADRMPRRREGTACRRLTTLARRVELVSRRLRTHRRQRRRCVPSGRAVIPSGRDLILTRRATIFGRREASSSGRSRTPIQRSGISSRRSVKMSFRRGVLSRLWAVMTITDDNQSRDEGMLRLWARGCLAGSAAVLNCPTTHRHGHTTPRGLTRVVQGDCSCRRVK